MRKLLRIFALLMAASMLIWMAGCGGDDDDDNDDDKGPAPTVSVSIPGTVFSNTDITVTFSKVMDPATVSITLDGAAVTPATTDNKVFTFKPGKEGTLALAITGKDTFGQDLETPYPGASITVGAADTTAPTIAGAKCDPKNGATGVDPADVSEITIVFSEAMASSTKMDSFEPEDANVDSEMSDDGTVLTISFLGGYKLGNETEVVVSISGEDLASNALDDNEYTFTTMAKEE
jgi:hypothetical protein